MEFFGVLGLISMPISSWRQTSIPEQDFLVVFRKEIKGGRTAYLNPLFHANSLQTENFLRVRQNLK